VADDDLYVRDALRAVLVSLGHQVETVESGRQALDRFTPEAFDLVITDLGMELSGREVTRAIKARSPGTPVIVVTGWAFDLSTDDLREVGADHVLAKPFQVNEVREMVAKALERRPSQQN
jgi:CheY-like chemotaxis protein